MFLLFQIGFVQMLDPSEHFRPESKYNDYNAVKRTKKDKSDFRQFEVFFLTPSKAKAGFQGTSKFGQFHQPACEPVTVNNCVYCTGPEIMCQKFTMPATPEAPNPPP